MSKFKPFLLCMLVLSGILILEVVFESSLHQSHNKDRQYRVTQQLNAIASKLHGIITNNLSLISGLSAHISTNPEINQQEFERYVKSVFRQQPLLINMAAAPNMVISMIYPLEPNRAALGLDYNKNLAQKYAASLTKSSGAMVVAGPVKLVQGGSAFIGRTATYDDAGNFWGIVSAPIDEQLLYRNAGLMATDLDINVAIRGKDGTGELGDVFFGDESLFGIFGISKVSIDVGQGSWVLVALDKNIGKQAPSGIWFLRLASIALVLLSFSFIYFRNQMSIKEYNYKQNLLNKASYDQLTGVANRFLFSEQLKKSIAHASRSQMKLAVLFIDLDGFKPVNDRFGHESGDLVLRKVAERLIESVRDCDTVARFSGDEFVVLLEDLHKIDVVAEVAEGMIRTINRPYVVLNNKVHCGASVGISIFPEDGRDIESLLSKADQAMYEVKRSGKNGWQYFTRAMQIRSEKRHNLHIKMIETIENRQLEVHYQPIVKLADNSVSKCEALVRWFDKGKQIPVTDFISLAEETGMINEIDRFVLASSTQYLLKQANEYGNRIGLSVNLSPRVFSSKDDSLNLWLSIILKASKDLDITVEITERLLIKDSEKVLQVLNELKEHGISIAIDDFGTGYSSLSYLSKFPIDILKIDKSFINCLGENSQSDMLVEAIIGLAHKLSLSVVAVGVKTSQQMELLNHWGCDFAQGYFFYEPMSADCFTDIFNEATIC